MTDWETQYRERRDINDEPHRLVTEFAARLAPGRALDVASGAGRHAIWLAEHGWNVTAVDSSSAGMGILEQRAREKAVRVETVLADLERHEFVIKPAAYDLIVVCNYLQRDLFPGIRAGTRAGGIVI